MLDELPVFVDTLDAPYVWEKSPSMTGNSKDDNAGHSPDVFFTPCKKRRRVSVTPEDKYQVSDLDEARPNDVLDACCIPF
ncbi:hypothetical protein VTP01DRAFT_7570 [Rhizomucor pusillus]|uniref:uncharacterized protein n=1 Tax=Rhizomucor pusillus TaxID=4840 RepID=UPI003742A9F1